MDRILGWRSDDLIIISDADEIPDGNTLLGLSTSMESPVTSRHSLLQSIYYYHIRNQLVTEIKENDKDVTLPKVWDLSYIMNYATYAEHNGTLHHHRADHIGKSIDIPRGGWHLSYFGDVQHIINKVKNFVHQEYNLDEYLDPDYVLNCIKQNKDLFGREDIKMIDLSIDNNEYLPTNIAILMKLFNQSNAL